MWRNSCKNHPLAHQPGKSLTSLFRLFLSPFLAQLNSLGKSHNRNHRTRLGHSLLTPTLSLVQPKFADPSPLTGYFLCSPAITWPSSVLGWACSFEFKAPNILQYIATLVPFQLPTLQIAFDYTALTFNSCNPTSSFRLNWLSSAPMSKTTTTVCSLPLHWEYLSS